MPYEKFQLAAAIDGREGRYRAPQAKCLVLAVNDHEAIGAWLAAQRPGEGNRELSSTQRCYRKEAERLLHV